MSPFGLTTVTSVKIKFDSYCEIMHVYEVIFTVHAAYVSYQDMPLTVDNYQNLQSFLFKISVSLLLTSVFRICKVFTDPDPRILPVLQPLPISTIF
jgi:hypothetical protein